MYALTESILEPAGEYRIEKYYLKVNGFDEVTIVDLMIFGDGDYESYIGEYTVMDDTEEISGACFNRKTKEETILAVEEEVITALMKKYGKGQ